MWRRSLYNDWLKNPELWVVWSYCLMKASHKKRIAKIGFQEIEIQPGQFIFGRKKAAEELNMSEWKIRASIDSLRKSGNLTIKTTNKFSIITIINWHIYQSEETEDHQQNRQQTANKPPTNRQQTATDKNVENVENGKNIKNIVEYLNQKTGKTFKYTSKETQRLITSRLNSGFKEEDFYTVIDNKCEKWLVDPKMIEYLRPQTLFGTKFESYLQDNPHPLQGKVSRTTIKNIAVLDKWRPKNEGSETI